MADFVQRDLGEYPLSIGTSMALSGLINQHPDNQNRPTEVRSITRLMVNIDTLVRNFLAAIISDQPQINLPDVVDLLMSEMEFITSFAHEHTHGRMKVGFYYQYTEDLKWSFPYALWKKPKTDRQKVTQAEQQVVSDALLSALTAQDKVKLTDALPRKINCDFDFTVCNRNLPSYPDHVAMLTHLPHQLLNRFNYLTLYLLESHTGKLKNHNAFSSKLKTAKKEQPVPFNRVTIQVFGEGNLFDPQPNNVRKAVLAIAKKCQWTVMTTDFKFKQDVSEQSDHELALVLEPLMRNGFS